MSARLILRLDADPEAPPAWLLEDGNGRVVDRGDAADLAELSAMARGARIVAVAPGTQVLLTRASVPTQNRQKLLKAVPYALEDQLADDVERLHFVPGQRDAEGNWPVAVVERAWLDAWLERLSEHGLSPDRMVPETLCLPWEPGQWTILADDTTARVRSAGQGGFAGDTVNLGTLLGVALDEPAAALPERLLVLDSGTSGLPHLPSEMANLPITREQVDDELALLARAVDDGQSMNLLTGSYTPAGSRRSRLRPWATVGVLFAVWLGLITGQTLLDQGRMRAELEQTNARILQELQRVHPRATDHRQARTRLENRLEQLQGGQSRSNDLLDTLLLVGPVLENSNDTTISALSWRTDSLELELNTSSLQNLDSIKQALDGTDGLSAEVRSARTEDDVVMGRLMVRRMNP